MQKQEDFRSPRVVIIGAGMTGLLMFIKLREAGITDITLFERKSRLGGTWRDNTYPGVACDVPAHMYTYSFEPNPEWRKRFADGSEIQNYFERVACKYGVIEHIQFNEAVTEAMYEAGHWRIGTSQGRTVQADFLVSATGILRVPKRPDIKGIDGFQGAMFHTAEWDHSVDLTGKRIGVIGTGSSATQVITTLGRQGHDLTVFQRTPQWILSYPNRDYSEQERERCRRNRLRPVITGKIQSFLIEQIGSKAVIGNPVQHAMVSMACKWNLRMNVKDANLRARLTPDYKVGCKRLILSDGYYDAIQRPNVRLITDGIQRITEQGVQTANGEQHALDVIVLASGFDPFAYFRPANIVGKQGVRIAEAWQDKVQAYRSLHLPDFPNFFLMLGPNSPIGNFSVIAISEVQTDYVLQLIRLWQRRRFDEVSAKREAMMSFNRHIKSGMGKTVWVSGCNSWYMDQDGDPAMWPYSWKQWVKEMATPDLNDFHLVSYPELQARPARPDPVRRLESA